MLVCSVGCWRVVGWVLVVWFRVLGFVEFAVWDVCRLVVVMGLIVDSLYFLWGGCHICVLG